MGEADKTPGLGLSRYVSPAGRTKEFFFANTRIVNVPHGIFTHQFRLITIGESLSRRLLAWSAWDSGPCARLSWRCHNVGMWRYNTTFEVQTWHLGFLIQSVFLRAQKGVMISGGSSEGGLQGSDRQRRTTASRLGCIGWVCSRRYCVIGMGKRHCMSSHLLRIGFFYGAQFCSWQCFVSHTARVFSRAAFGFGRCMSDRDALNPAWARHARTHGIAALVEIGPIAGRHSLISQYDDDTYICR